MAEVAELFFIPPEEADDDDILVAPALNFPDFFDPIFSTHESTRHPWPLTLDSGSDSDFIDDPISLALDLFDRRPSEFAVLDGLEDKEGSGFDIGEEVGEGLRIVGFGSDSDLDDEPIAALGGGAAPDLSWDCFRIDEEQRGPEEDFEWEEIDGRLDERDVLSMMVGVDDNESDEEMSGRDVLSMMVGVDDNESDEEMGGSVEWEILLASSNLVGNPFVEHDEGVESYIGDDHEDFVNTSEYEVMFEQFESAVQGSPPAAKLVVKNLASVILTEEDVSKNNTLCAVCKDDICLGEVATQLPCLHHYHGECILPWLAIRNTCPVCRYELPTDDREYENWRERRDGSAGPAGSLVRYDTQIYR